MARGDWTKFGVAWDDGAGDNRTGDNKPTISFVNGLKCGAWYNIDTTAAVRDALENRKPHLGIRSASPPQVLVHPRPGRGRGPSRARYHPPADGGRRIGGRERARRGKPCLGIWIVALEDHTRAFYLGLRERVKERSRLVVRWRTATPTGRPCSC